MLASSLLALFSVVASTAIATPIKRSGENTATYYDVGLGACGWTNTDSEMVVAMNAPEWNNGADCGKYVSITCTKTGNTATAQVVDLCPGCGTGSLDMSPALFNQLSNNNPGWGVFPITWEFTDGSGSGSGAASASASVGAASASASVSAGAASASASVSAGADASPAAAKVLAGADTTATEAVAADTTATEAAAADTTATEAVNVAAAPAATETGASSDTTSSDITSSNTTSSDTTSSGSSSSNNSSSHHGHHGHHHGNWHNGTGGGN